MIASLLIANRGEIACRIIRTARAMGIRTVAVYSDADAKALHVRQADEVVHIGPSPARESYLRGDKIIAAALATGAEAIHPGYGFLSENAEFAEAVAAAGLIWVGATPHSIRAMGLKDAAKKLMADAGVPVTPGYLGEDQTPERLRAEADGVGYPVLIKAVAGGGGKGMRRVDAAADFADALASCKREAASSFGDDRVLIEKYITAPRHIEVQVFGDTHGNIVHLFERDCSLQRRHQKVIEEAPAPGMSEDTRAALCETAVRAARAVDYVGAGTIEFIADASEGLRADRIWFMEMNTRLQVEHPVTEEITGVDLVEWQLRVASGETLPKRQEELSINGWAIEARLYAEDPAKGFLPSVGRLEHLMLPENRLRVEAGVYEGAEVTAFYDPMIAKLIAKGGDRDTAIEELRTACCHTAVWPVRTNAAFLAQCLADPDFLTGSIDTGLINRRDKALIPDSAPPEAVIKAGAMGIAAAATGERPVQVGWGLARSTNADEPWQALFGFRLSGPAQPAVRIDLDGMAYAVAITSPWDPLDAWVETAGEVILSGVNDGRVFGITASRGRSGGSATNSDGALLAPMPGRITAVEVAPGDTVTKGQRLVTLEAMKMEHALTAPFDGVVAELNANPGAQVPVEALLVRVAAAE
ncbi:MAG: methylcrotonoyl-CoA carboxylase [Proteobacteria bacterium SG_bin6]|nr:MAG: methylcrotonoyl-CoA carboxylase [Proteobacteria bacterium SG_bin6]